MFVEKKQNKSGSTSVRVMQKVHGKRKCLKVMGCSSDAEEIDMLIKRGNRWIEEHQTGVPLFEFDDEAVAYDKVLAGLRQSQLRLVGPELVYGTLFDRIGYDKVKTANNALFRALVVTRLYHPGSKLRTAEYMERFMHQSYSSDAIYRFLDELCARGKTADQVREAADGTYFVSIDLNGDHDFTNDYRYIFTRQQIEKGRNFVPQRFGNIWVAPDIFINGIARGNRTYTIPHPFNGFCPMLSVHDFCTGQFNYNGKPYYICSAYDRSEFAIIDSMPSNNDALARYLLDENLLKEVKFPVIRDSLIFQFLDLNYGNQQYRISITPLTEATQPVSPFVGFRAPTFAAKDLKGKTVKLGKGYTLLDFWGSWCNPCIALVPHLVEIHEHYPNLNIISIANERDKTTIPKLKKLICEHNMDWTHACEISNDSTNMANKFAVSSFPTTFIIDPLGNVVFRGTGSNDTAKLKKKLAEIFRE